MYCYSSVPGINSCPTPPYPVRSRAIVRPVYLNLIMMYRDSSITRIPLCLTPPYPVRSHAIVHPVYLNRIVLYQSIARILLCPTPPHRVHPHAMQMRTMTVTWTGVTWTRTMQRRSCSKIRKSLERYYCLGVFVKAASRDWGLSVQLGLP